VSHSSARAAENSWSTDTHTHIHTHTYEFSSVLQSSYNSLRKGCYAPVNPLVYSGNNYVPHVLILKNAIYVLTMRVSLYFIQSQNKQPLLIHYSKMCLCSEDRVCCRGTKWIYKNLLHKLGHSKVESLRHSCVPKTKTREEEPRSKDYSYRKTNEQTQS